MTNTEALAVLVGILMPPLVSWLKNCDWPSKWKFVLSVAVSLGLGFATSYFAGALVFSLEHALIDTAIVFIAGQGVYKLWFEGTTLERRLTGGTVPPPTP